MKEIIKKDQIKAKRELFIIITIFIIATIIRFFISNFSKSMFVYGDELRYYGIARSIFDGKGISLRNASTDFQKIIYSIILSPLFLIKNAAYRVSAIGLINSLIMSSSIFPVWLISKELQLCKKDTYYMMFIVLLWPDMLFSMTFMSENLYWPLFLWFVFLWLMNRKRQRCLLAIFEGIICYIGYMCKEIFLAVFLSYIIIELFYPLLEYLIIKKDRSKTVRSFFDSKSIFVLVTFTGTFIICHILSKLVLFSGMGNSYNQMGISAILSVYNFSYMIYGFLYYIAAILLASMIFPFVYPIINLKKIDKKSCKLFCFLILFLLIASATIAYTITVREDLGKIVPRIHLRYVGPAIILLFVMFFKSIQIDNEEINNNIKDKFPVTLTFVLFFVCIILKGVDFGVSVDQYALLWYALIQKIIGKLIAPNNGTCDIYIYRIIVDFFIFCIGYVLHYIYTRKNKLAMKRIFVAIVTLICLSNNIIGIVRIRHEYFVDKSIVNDIQKISDYFSNLEGIDSKSKLYITKDSEITILSKYFDTYFDDSQNLYIVSNKQLGLDVNSEVNVSDLDMREPIYQSKYRKIDEVNYIIVENGVDFGNEKLSNTEIIPEISNDCYTVYRNLKPNTLSLEINNELYFNGEKMSINFTGNEYNANKYVLNGISEKEDAFSWTCGNKMIVKIPVRKDCGKINVTLSILDTFNGSKSYIIKQNDIQITSGNIMGKGEISFDIIPRDNTLLFEIDFPDAQVISDVIADSNDNRKVAFQLQTMTLSTEREEN